MTQDTIDIKVEDEKLAREAAEKRAKKALEAFKALSALKATPAWATVLLVVLFSSQSAWTAAVACLALSAGYTFDPGAGFLVAGGLAALTAAVRGQKR